MRRLAARRWVTVWQMRLTLRDGGLGMGIAGGLLGYYLWRGMDSLCVTRAQSVCLILIVANASRAYRLPQKAEIRA